MSLGLARHEDEWDRCVGGTPLPRAVRPVPSTPLSRPRAELTRHKEQDQEDSQRFLRDRPLRRAHAQSHSQALLAPVLGRSCLRAGDPCTRQMTVSGSRRASVCSKGPICNDRDRWAINSSNSKPPLETAVSASTEALQRATDFGKSSNMAFSLPRTVRDKRDRHLKFLPRPGRRRIATRRPGIQQQAEDSAYLPGIHYAFGRLFGQGRPGIGQSNFSQTALSRSIGQKRLSLKQFRCRASEGLGGRVDCPRSEPDDRYGRQCPSRFGSLASSLDVNRRHEWTHPSLSFQSLIAPIGVETPRRMTICQMLFKKHAAGGG